MSGNWLTDEFESYLKWHAWQHSKRRRVLSWSLELGLPAALLALAIATWRGW